MSGDDGNPVVNTKLDENIKFEIRILTQSESHTERKPQAEDSNRIFVLG